jgi:cysteine synthase A
LVEHDGIFVGSSSAVNCKSFMSLRVMRQSDDIGVAATKLATMLGPGHRIVTILCDR